MIRYICIKKILNKKNIDIYQKYKKRIAEVNKIPTDEILHHSN